VTAGNVVGASTSADLDTAGSFAAADGRAQDLAAAGPLPAAPFAAGLLAVGPGVPAAGVTADADPTTSPGGDLLGGGAPCAPSFGVVSERCMLTTGRTGADANAAEATGAVRAEVALGTWLAGVTPAASPDAGVALRGAGVATGCGLDAVRSSPGDEAPGGGGEAAAPPSRSNEPPSSVNWTGTGPGPLGESSAISAAFSRRDGAPPGCDGMAPGLSGTGVGSPAGPRVSAGPLDLPATVRWSATGDGSGRGDDVARSDGLLTAAAGPAGGALR
jgi:hypothetical protein